MGYCLDEAVWSFGKWVEEKVEEAGDSGPKKGDSDKKKRLRMQRAFEKCMGLEPKFRPIG